MTEPLEQISADDIPLRDVAACRADFPTLDQDINGQQLTYLDSAASSQMPQSVIDAISQYQSHDHANVHRGVHTLSHRATEAYECARDAVVEFIGAASRAEVILTSGTTESINLVAQSFARPKLGVGSKIVITHLEHHSNIVPWQLVAEQTGAEVVVAPIEEDGDIDVDKLVQLLDESVTILAIAHVSNALGTVIPVKQITAIAHERGIPVLVDGAQAAPHIEVNVRDIDCDFYALSAHKMFGPTGVGVLYGKQHLLEAMPPYQGGGDMIIEVRFDGTTYNDLPYKFEAGTPNISGVIGLGAAIAYLNQVGMKNVAEHEHRLLQYMMEKLAEIESVRLVGTARNKASVQSFMLGDVHPHDVGTILDNQGVAIRTGHHCAMPVMDFFGVPGTARASLAFYNNSGDIDRLVLALSKVQQIFAL